VWAWFVSTKIGRWLVGIAVTLAAVAAALVVAFVKGKHAQADKDAAKDDQSLADAAQQVVTAANARQEVENENAALPDAPPQTVANASPGTAAGDLRDDGWVRGTEDPNGH
jgi:hypothetical protein